MQKINWHAKYKQLGKIRSAALGAQKLNLGPRFSLALIIGVSVNILVYTLQQDKDYWSWAIAAGALAGFITYKLNTLPRTNIERLDDLLAQYEPINAEAFRALQVRVREAGAYDINHVMEWIGIERHSIDLAAGILKAASSKYLDRKL